MSLEFNAALQLGDFPYAAALRADNEILVLFGPSGAGKSMTLQIAAGLLTPASGLVKIDGRTVFDSSSRTNIAPQERGVGYVVQNLALFPHMTVEANVMFGMRGTREEKRAKARAMLQQFGMAGFAQRMPRTLSGGQAQRVALARALARDARLLLLDEPFSALDDALRKDMRNELLRLRNELGLTIVFVTHDSREAHLLADRIAVFDAGGVLQAGARDAVFRKPLNSRVARLTGMTNVISGKVIRSDRSSLLVDALGSSLRCASWAGNLSDYAEGRRVELAIRSERVNLRRTVSEADENVFESSIAADFPFGSNHVLNLTIKHSGQPMEVEISSRPYEVLGVGSTKDWLIELPAADLHVMPGLP